MYHDKKLTVGGIEFPLSMCKPVIPGHNYVKDSTSGLYLPFSINMTDNPFGFTNTDIAENTKPIDLDRMVRLSLAFPKIRDMLSIQHIPLVNITTNRLLEILEKKGE